MINLIKPFSSQRPNKLKHNSTCTHAQTQKFTVVICAFQENSPGSGNVVSKAKTYNINLIQY